MRQMIYVLPIILATFFAASCSKKGSEPQAIDVSKLNGIEKIVSVSNKGYLVFASKKDAVEFDKLLAKSNKEDVDNYLASKGFKRRKHNALARTNEEASDSPYDVYFNEDGLLQLENIIMRITGDEQFIYTITEDNLTEETLTQIINESYEAGLMNKITVDRDKDVEFDITLFIDEHPNGVVEDAQQGTASRRPMFGTTTHCYNGWYTDPITNVPFHYYWIEKDTYAFWIHTKHTESEWFKGSCPQ
jgi:hypothetical protein